MNNIFSWIKKITCIAVFIVLSNIGNEANANLVCRSLVCVPGAISQTPTPSTEIQPTTTSPRKYIPIDIGDIFTIIPVDAPFLVPDPKSAGTTTVAGVDSNNNGFRDDVERFIYINYWNDPVGMGIVKKQALAMLTILKHANDPSIVSNEMENIVNSSRCFRTTHPNDANNREMDLEAAVLNTVNRLLEWNKAEGKMAGRLFNAVDPAIYYTFCK